MSNSNFNMAEFSDFLPLDFKKEGIVLDYKTAGVDIEAGNYEFQCEPHAGAGMKGVIHVN